LRDLGLIDRTVAVRIELAEALLGLGGGRLQEFFLGNLAVAVGVGLLDEFGDASTGAFAASATGSAGPSATLLCHGCSRGEAQKTDSE